MGYKNNNALSYYSMDAAIDMATRDAVANAIGKVCAALDISVGGAVRGAVGDAVRGAVGDAVGGAVGDAVRDAVLDAVHNIMSQAIKEGKND